MIPGLEELIQNIVEFGYSRGIYPKIAETLANIVDRVPFSISEISVYALAAAAIGIPSYYGIRTAYKKIRRRKENDTLHFRDIFSNYKESFKRTGHRITNATKKAGYNIKYDTKQTLKRAGIKTGKIIGITALSLSILAGTVFVAFETTFGLNYFRPPIEEKLGLELEVPSQNNLVIFGSHLAIKINKDMHLMEKEEKLSLDEISSIMYTEISRTIYQLDGTRIKFPHRAKELFFEKFFTYTRSDAFVYPLLLEINYDDRQEFYNRGFNIGHEDVHTVGYTEESFANFVSYITCRNSTYAQIRVGAEKAMFDTVLRYIKSNQIKELLKNMLSLKVKENFAKDNKLIAEKMEQSSKAWVDTYDKYLKVNGMEEGIQTYDKSLLYVLAYDKKLN